MSGKVGTGSQPRASLGGAHCTALPGPRVLPKGMAGWSAQHAAVGPQVWRVPAGCAGQESMRAVSTNTNLQVSGDHPAVREEVVGHLANGVLYPQSLAVLPGFQTGKAELGLRPAEDGQHPAGDSFRGFLHGLGPDFHRVQTCPERSAFGKIRARDEAGKPKPAGQNAGPMLRAETPIPARLPGRTAMFRVSASVTWRHTV